MSNIQELLIQKINIKKNLVLRGCGFDFFWNRNIEKVEENVLTPFIQHHMPEYLDILMDLNIQISKILNDVNFEKELEEKDWKKMKLIIKEIKNSDKRKEYLKEFIKSEKMRNSKRLCYTASLLNWIDLLVDSIYNKQTYLFIKYLNVNSMNYLRRDGESTLIPEECTFYLPYLSSYLIGKNESNDNFWHFGYTEINFNEINLNIKFWKDKFPHVSRYLNN